VVRALHRALVEAPSAELLDTSRRPASARSAMRRSSVPSPRTAAARKAMRSAYDFVVLAVASADSVSALRTVLAALPRRFPAALAVVQHRGPSTPDRINSVLASATLLSLKQAVGGERLAAGTVYVAPSYQHMTLTAGRRVALASGQGTNRLRSAADPLFEAAGRAYGARVIAVILTGYDGDGAAGARALKALGGTVLAEEPATDEVPQTARAAVAAADIDLVLPLAAIGPALVRLVKAGV
jgi:two-component system, chemotaxis family, protein-glutamate methylesterase/glutaminase